MAVTIDATGTDQLSGTTNVTSFNYTGLTISSGLTNSALIVGVSFCPVGGAVNTAPTSFSLHWDSTGTNQAMTQIVRQVGPGSQTGEGVELWGLVNPTPGNKTLALSWTNGSQVDVVGISVSGANQTGGATTFAQSTSNTTSNGSSLTVTVTSASGDMVFAAFTQTGSSSFSSVNNTQIYVDNGGQAFDAGAGRAAGAATVSMTATFGASAQVGVGAGCDIVAAATSFLDPTSIQCFVMP